MVIILVLQAVFITMLLLSPWKWLAHLMEVEVMKPEEKEESIFRIYVLLIPVLHLVLAIGIEVSFVVEKF